MDPPVQVSSLASVSFIWAGLDYSTVHPSPCVTDTVKDTFKLHCHVAMAMCERVRTVTGPCAFILKCFFLLPGFVVQEDVAALYRVCVCVFVYTYLFCGTQH